MSGYIRGLSSLVICMLSLFAVTKAGAETIDFTITQSGNTIDATPFVEAGSTPSSATVNATLLNMALGSIGSAYRFAVLGGLSGASDFPGAPQNAHLIVSGVISASVPTGDFSPLTVKETESGFMAPSGVLPANLEGSTSALFTNCIPCTQTMQGSLNTTLTPSVVLTASGSGANTIPVPGFFTPFTLDNAITFSLTSGGTASFAGAANLTEVPLPPALFLFGSVVGGAFWLGRRKRRLAG